MITCFFTNGIFGCSFRTCTKMNIYGYYSELQYKKNHAWHVIRERSKIKLNNYNMNFLISFWQMTLLKKWAAASNEGMSRAYSLQIPSSFKLLVKTSIIVNYAWWKFIHKISFKRVEKHQKNGKQFSIIFTSEPPWREASLWFPIL